VSDVVEQARFYRGAAGGITDRGQPKRVFGNPSNSALRALRWEQSVASLVEDTPFTRSPVVTF
jgi:hypothetical protein